MSRLPSHPLLRASFLAAATLTCADTAASLSVRTGHAHAELVASVTSIAPHDSFTVALRLVPDTGWHVYWSNPGDAGMPPTLTWRLPRDWTAAPLRFPVPERQDVPPFASFGYEREVWYPANVFAGGEGAGSRVPLHVRAEWLICREECLPESADFTLMLDRGATVPHATDAERLETFARARLPRPQPDWGWTVAYDDSTVTIGWDLSSSRGSFAPDDDVFFFPAEIGMLMHAAPQTLTIREDRAHLTMKRDDVLHMKPDTLRGVIAFGRNGSAARHGYELTLTAAPAAETRTGFLPVLLVGLLAFAGLILLIILKRPHVTTAR